MAVPVERCRRELAAASARLSDVDRSELTAHRPGRQRREVLQHRIGRGHDLQRLVVLTLGGRLGRIAEAQLRWLADGSGAKRYAHPSTITTGFAATLCAEYSTSGMKRFDAHLMPRASLAPPET